jgi:hypothetical protein
LDPATLQYGSTPLKRTSPDIDDGFISWTLPPKGTPGSDIQVVLGLMRDQMTGNPGDISAGVLQLTDDQGLMLLNLGVTAIKSNPAGLWVGEAQISKIVQYLVNYERDPSGNPVIKLTEKDGSYSVLTKNSVLGSVPQTFPIRLILHDDGTKQFLLQRVFLGTDLTTNSIVATKQSFIDPALLGSARRISAVHMPWSESNTPWEMTKVGSVYSATIITPYDNPGSNPFVHQYHPDHDNLNASFKQVLPKGNESYGISRSISLSQQAPGSDYVGQTIGSMERRGIYEETLTVEGVGTGVRSFKVVGTFYLNRISPISKLTK